MDTVQEKRLTQNGFKVHGILMVALLMAQYILGMLTNLFVQFPQTSNESQLWEFARSQRTEISHILLGVILFISAIVFVIRAIVKRNQPWIVWSSVGLVAIGTAIFAGARFIPTQVDQYSLVMAIAFIAALFAYSWGLYAAKR